MKAFYCNTLLLLTTFLWIGSYEYPFRKRNICDDQSDQVKIISLFNFHTDLIIQTQEMLSGNISFWRVYDTDMKSFDSDYSNDPKTISLKVKEKVHLIENFYRDIKSLSMNGLVIDPDKPIIGHSIPLEMTAHIFMACSQVNQSISSSVKPTNETCQLFNSLNLGKKLVCIYNSPGGNSNLKGIVAQYNIIPNGVVDQDGIGIVGLTNLGSKVIPLFKNICQLPPRTVSICFNDTSIYSKAWFSILNSHKNDTPSKIIISFREYKTFHSSVHFVVDHPYHCYYNFKFNKYYSLMSCPKNCTLDAPLYFVKENVGYTPSKEKYQNIETVSDFFSEESFSNFKLVYSLAKDLTLRRMLGCKITPTLFDPNYFCYRKRQFLSILSLGNDVYFQARGRFWRYNSYGFDKSFPNNRSVRMVPLRFDSDITSLLENYNDIETSEPVYGFTFDSGLHDSCRGDDVNCNRRLSSSNQYFSACIYGLSNKYETKNHLIKRKALYYTPEGLRPFRNETLGNEIAKDCRLIQKALGEKQIESIAVEQSLEGSAKLHKFYVISRKGTEKYLEFYTLHTLRITARLKSMKIHDQVISVFIFHSKLYLYQIDSLYSVRTIDDDIQIVAFPYKGHIINLLFCPFKSSNSLVTVKREGVCQWIKTTSVESVFTIGSHHYHQVGQHFYKYNEYNDSRFYYDKHVTDLFNDYFDTRHQVTGFSVPRGSKGEASQHFEVLIHGKSNELYKSIGKYIYALFMIGENRISALSTRTFEFQYFSNGSIGPALNWGFDGFIEAFALITPLKGNINLQTIDKHLVWIDFNKIKGKKILGTASYSSKDFNFLFNYNILSKINWRKKRNVPFDEIIGFHDIYQDHQRLITKHKLLLSAKKSGKQIEEFDPVQYVPLKVLYRDLFCTSNSSDDSSLDFGHDFKTVTSIIAFLILVLIVLVFVVTFYSYRSNQNLIDQKQKSNAKIGVWDKKKLNNSRVTESETQSVKQGSNQINTEVQDSSQSLDINSKASESLSTKSE